MISPWCICRCDVSNTSQCSPVKILRFLFVKILDFDFPLFVAWFTLVFFTDFALELKKILCNSLIPFPVFVFGHVLYCCHRSWHFGCALCSSRSSCRYRYWLDFSWSLSFLHVSYSVSPLFFVHRLSSRSSSSMSHWVTGFTYLGR